MAIDITEIYNIYKGLWVALKEDRTTVVASGKTIKETQEGAQQKGVDDPIFFKVPTRILPQIGRV